MATDAGQTAPTSDGGSGAAPVSTPPESAVATAAEQYLVPLDPLRALAWMCVDIDRFAQLDPKVRTAMRQLSDRLEELPQHDRENIVAPMLWVSIRAHLKASPGLRGFRLWIGDGDLVLQTVEAALQTTFSLETLREAVRLSGEVAEPGSDGAGELQRARAELQGFASEDIGPATAAAVAVGFTLGVGAATLYHMATSPDGVAHVSL